MIESVQKRLNPNGLFLQTVVFGFISSVYIFLFNSKIDSLPGDARFNAALLSYHSRKINQPLELRADFLFGTGTLQWGYLFAFEPTAIIGSLFSDGYNFFLVAISMSIAIFFLANIFLKTYSLNRLERLLASYLVAITSIWSYSISIVDNYLFAHVPQYSSFLVLNICALICFIKIGVGSHKKSIIYASVFLILNVYMIVVFTQILVTSFILFAAVVTGSLLSLAHQKEFKEFCIKILSLFFSTICLLLLGTADYVQGFYRNTAAAEIPLTRFNNPSLRNVPKFLFETFFPSPSPTGNNEVQFIFAFLLVLFILKGVFLNKFRTKLWFTTFVIFILLLTYRVYQTQWVYEKGPNHNYLVWMLSIFYIAGPICLLFEVASKLLGRFKRLRHSFFKFAFCLIPLANLIFVMSPLSSVYEVEADSSAGMSYSDDFNLEAVQDIALNIERQFRGRVVYLKEQPNYPDLIVRQVPLLNDYSHNLTPFAYRFYKEFLFDPVDTQRRNHFLFGAQNLEIYGLLGVKYYVTTESDSINALRQESDLRKVNSSPTLSLFEHADPNIGNFSPISVSVSSSLMKTFQIMKQANFQPNIDVVVQENYSFELVPMTTSKLLVNDDSLRITAVSNGTSMVIVPLEFSSCLNLVELSSTSKMLDYRIVDGLLLGITFEKNLDIAISLEFGLLQNSDCRLKDLNFYRSLSAGFLD